MKNIDHLPREERKYFEQCNCGEYFDCRDLGEVFKHVHEIKLPKAEWQFSIKLGEATAYTKKKNRLDLN